jgi:hypothetical protein
LPIDSAHLPVYPSLHNPEAHVFASLTHNAGIDSAPTQSFSK